MIRSNHRDGAPWVATEADLIIVHLVRAEPLLLRRWMGLIPDDNAVWTFGGMIGSAVLDETMTTTPVMY